MAVNFPNPAMGPNLIPAIERALEELRRYLNEQVKRGKMKAEAPDGARVLENLLTLSRDKAYDNIAPYVRRGDLAIPARVKLDARKWSSVHAWYRANMLERLETASREHGTKVLFPIRKSEQRGGYSDSSEALYYLSFSPVSAEEDDDAEDAPAHEVPQERKRKSKEYWLAAGGALLGAATAIAVLMLLRPH